MLLSKNPKKRPVFCSTDYNLLTLQKNKFQLFCSKKEQTAYNKTQKVSFKCYIFPVLTFIYKQNTLSLHYNCSKIVKLIRFFGVPNIFS